MTGFGPFGGVADNPSERLIRALDGRSTGGIALVGVVLPVSFSRGPALAIEAAKAAGPGLRMVLGFGVAMGRDGLWVEAVGQARSGAGLDVDGNAGGVLPGPEVVEATVDLPRLTRCLGAKISRDAGAYVCNAWLHQVTLGLPGLPVGFVHIPAEGADPESVVAGLGRYWGASGTATS